ncbi:MAG: PKD domain-containing protein, partial [Thermodesulfobacteriota bacterium]
TDTVTVTVGDVNQPPVANAGPDQSVNEGAGVTLNGSGTDPDGTIASYAWVQTAGAAVALSGASMATASFTAPPAGPSGASLAFRLTVTDNLGATANDTVTIAVRNVNQAPVAQAGPDQTVEQGTTVTLDGANSTDPDGDALAWSWIQTAGPAVALSGASAAQAAFTAPPVGPEGLSLAFLLTVTDPAGLTGTDAVIVNVSHVNQPPVANAGADRTVPEGSPVTLDGTGSWDPDGALAGYSWVQRSGAPVALTGADTPQPSFLAPTVDSGGASLEFELTVEDSGGLQATDRVVVNISNVNQPPLADAGADRTADEDSAVTLDGSASRDPDGSVAAYAWRQTSGLPVVLSAPSAARTTFLAPAVGPAGALLVFELRVTDDGGLAATAQVSVQVLDCNRSPILTISGITQVVEGEAVSLLLSASDPDGDPVTLLVSPALPGAVLAEVAPGSAEYLWSTRPGDAGSYTVSFTASDGSLSALEQVSLTVTAAAAPPEDPPGSPEPEPEEPGQEPVVSAPDEGGEAQPNPAVPVLRSLRPDPAKPLTLLGVDLAPPAGADPASVQRVEWSLWDGPLENEVLRAVIPTQGMPSELELPWGVLLPATAYRATVRLGFAGGAWSGWSEPTPWATPGADPRDTDGNGVDDRMEVRGYTDVNRDGIDDAQQGIAVFREPQGGNLVGVAVSHGRLDRMAARRADELEPAERPADELPYGLFSFRIGGLAPGASTTVTFHFPDVLPADARWYKVGASGVPEDLTSQVLFAGRTAVLTLTDGGAGDEDGAVNGVIVDPGGPALRVGTSAPPAPESSDLGGGGGGGGGGCFLQSLGR